MRFDSIQIRNYRQYRCLDMQFPRAKKTDLHVIVASNGVGKTNMLNAINWCLYEKEPHLGDINDSLSICNLLALQEAKEAGKTEVEVSVVITASSENEKFIFERTLAVKTATAFAMKPVFKIRRIAASGESEIIENDEAVSIVEEHLPQKIRQYFFFDGEQLFNYFGVNHDTTHVKDSIHQIAQVSVVTGARTHLDLMIAEYKKSIGKLNPEVEGINTQIAEKEEKIQQYLDQIEQLKKSIELSEQIVADLNLKISGTESVVEDNKRYETVLHQIEELEKKRQELQSDLRALVRKYYVFLMLYDVHVGTAAFIQEKYDKGVLPPSLDIGLIKQSLHDKECVICKGHISASTELYLQSLIKKYAVSSAVSHKLTEIKSDVSRAVKEACEFQSKRDTLFVQITTTDDAIAQLIEECDILYKRISSCSSVEQISMWMDQRKTNQEMIKTNSVKVGAYEAQVTQLKEDIEKLDEKTKKAISQMAECEELKKELSFAQRSRDVLSEIENEITTDVRQRMETETMSQFARLIWKQNTYGRIELSSNYQLRLFHKMTGDSCLGSCSAAERELLALAFTIALHKISGHESLLFIDTPVGRVSDLNRENFAKSLIDVSTYKQLILAFTPSEFSEEVSKYFNPSVLSSKNRLESNGEDDTRKEM